MTINLLRPKGVLRELPIDVTPRKIFSTSTIKVKINVTASACITIHLTKRGSQNMFHTANTGGENYSEA